MIYHFVVGFVVGYLVGMLIFITIPKFNKLSNLKIDNQKEVGDE